MFSERMFIVKLKIINKVSEIVESDVDEATVLSKISTWDSLSYVVFIAFAISDFGVKLTGEEMMQAETVRDLVKLIENKVKS